MNKTPLAALAAALMATTSLPGLHAEPGGDDVQVATGPCEAAIKQALTLGVGADCTPAIFDVTHWNADPANTGARTVTVWAEWVRGTFVTGFHVSACGDRNDDGVCTRSGGDDVEVGYSNDGLSTTGEPGCTKDEKDCGDPTAARVEVCVRPDHGGGYDDVRAFVGDWADAGAGGNVGAGVSSGDYEVWFTEGPWVAEC